MGMSGVGNGSAASGGNSSLSTGSKEGSLVAAPNADQSMRSGQKVASPSNQGSLDTGKSGSLVASGSAAPTMQSGQKVASPNGGGGTSAKQIESYKPSTGGPTYDQRDYLPDSKLGRP